MKKEYQIDFTFICFLAILFLFIGWVIGVNDCKNFYSNYDVNKDGIINSQDYVLIKKYIMDNK